MYNKWFNHKYNEGYTLVLAMFVIVIILSFGTVILNITLSEFKQSERYKNSLKAYFLARSGAELAADIILDPNNNKIMLEENEFALKDGNNNVIIKKIKVKKINNSSNFLITSTAEAGSNPVSKTVSLQINKNNLFDNTIFTKADLDISHNNSSVSGTIESNGQIIDPDDKVLEENKTENSNKKYLPVPEIPSETDFNNPNDGSVFNGEKIASNSYYTKININNDNLILDTTNGTENDTDDDKNILVVNSKIELYTQMTDNLENIDINQDFIFGNYFKRVYKLISIDDSTKDGLAVMTMELTQSNANDDLDDNIADNPQSDSDVLRVDSSLDDTYYLLSPKSSEIRLYDVVSYDIRHYDVSDTLLSTTFTFNIIGIDSDSYNLTDITGNGFTLESVAEGGNGTLEIINTDTSEIISVNIELGGLFNGWYNI